MAYSLGVDLGTTYTATAVQRGGRVEIVTLGNRAASVPSVIFLKEDESILTGDAASRRAVTEPDRVAREFKRRVGDPTPVILGGTPYSVEALMAKLLRWTIDSAGLREGGAPDSVAVTHPANWGPYKKDLLAQAFRLADLDDVITLTEPEAAAIYYASHERVEVGSVVAVYDLGGGTFDAAVLRKTEGGWDVLGDPEGIERLGGIDFDEAVFDHVRQALGDSFAQLDHDDPVVRHALARVRQDCVEAKEALSSDTDVAIPVVLPSVQTEVRLTRYEFENMIRPTLQDTIGAMRRALRSADVEPDAVSSVLLVGGSSRTPLVAQMISAEFGRPVAVDAHPKHAIALGAALATAPRASGARTAPVVDAGVDADRPAAGGPEPVPTEDPAPTPAGPRGAAPPPRVPADPPPLSDATSERQPQGAPVPSSSSDLDGSGVRKFPMAALVGGGGLLLIVMLIALLVTSGGGGDDAGSDEAAEAAAESEATDEGETTDGDPPVPETEFVRIGDVRIATDRYVFDFETFNFEPAIDDPGSFHIHFFWDDLDPANAGVNGPSPGEWLIWDSPSTVEDPFFELGNRPEGSERICGIVASHDHAVADIDGDDAPDTDTGECVRVPDAVEIPTNDDR